MNERKALRQIRRLEREREAARLRVESLEAYAEGTEALRAWQTAGGTHEEAAAIVRRLLAIDRRGLEPSEREWMDELRRAAGEAGILKQSQLRLVDSSLRTEALRGVG